MPRVPKTFLDKMAKTIKTEVRPNRKPIGEDFFAQWYGKVPDYHHPDVVFSNSAGDVVSRDYIAEKFGKPTKKNAAKFFHMQSLMEPRHLAEENDWERMTKKELETINRNDKLLKDLYGIDY